MRIILVFDEVYGLIPPHRANPPTKKPLVSLLKQARALGLSVVLPTQNLTDWDLRGALECCRVVPSWVRCRTHERRFTRIMIPGATRYRHLIFAFTFACVAAGIDVCSSRLDWHRAQSHRDVHRPTSSLSFACCDEDRPRGSAQQLLLRTEV
jgi:hypothetical protein